jgi:peptidoglycan hydrolase-like protein with peptidoglycan-binding domain
MSYAVVRRIPRFYGLLGLGVFAGYAVLKLGDTGPQVLDLQKALTSLGTNVKPTGTFDAATKGGVMWVQQKAARARGATITDPTSGQQAVSPSLLTGIADAQFWTDLDNLIGAASAAADAKLSKGRPNLQKGSTGDLVKGVQSIIGAKADGIFGPNTETALRAFQSAHGLNADGIVGPQTWGVLDSLNPGALLSAQAQANMQAGMQAALQMIDPNPEATRAAAAAAAPAPVPVPVPVPAVATVSPMTPDVPVPQIAPSAPPGSKALVAIGPSGGVMAWWNGQSTMMKLAVGGGAVLALALVFGGSKPAQATPNRRKGR